MYYVLGNNKKTNLSTYQRNYLGASYFINLLCALQTHDSPKMKFIAIRERTFKK